MKKRVLGTRRRPARESDHMSAILLGINPMTLGKLNFTSLNLSGFIC